jgi:lytic murein transglycosylase
MTRNVIRQRSAHAGAMLAAVLLILLGVGLPAHAADAAFQTWLQTVWPDAQQRGISRATFDLATRGLEPDLSLPDLVLPGKEAPQRGQAEFVQTPADYIKEPTIARLAAQGRKLAEEQRATLAAIEQRFGVPGAIILAIWGRETDYGRQKDSRSALRVLATQAYLGRRKDQFREEFLFALKMLEDGHVKLPDLRSSWAGAMGLTQFLPSEFYKHGVDFDGDGRIDIFNSVPDALASAARQLVDKGWRPGQHWFYEVRAPKDVDCTTADPGVTLPIAEWLKRGFAPAYGRVLRANELSEQASLLLPAGTYGPAFLILSNYHVIKSYNFSDLYVLFVGHLADRIGDPRPFETPWAQVAQLETAQLVRMQRYLTEHGFYGDKIDGKAGMKTRLALGAYQKATKLKLDCWPTRAVVDHMAGNAVPREPRPPGG